MNQFVTLTVPGEFSNSLDMGKKARGGQDDTIKK